MRIKNNTGFTLIELIVAIGILGVMATTAIAVLNPFAQFQKANDAKRKGDLSQVQKALETYYQDYGEYPAYTNNSYYLDPTTAPNTRTPKTWGLSWQPYMNVIPSDPDKNKKYVYYTSPDRQSYYLYASLDRGTSADHCQGTDPCGSSKCSSSAGGTYTCNFGVSSPDQTP
jgi:type II secretion system protein G